MGVSRPTARKWMPEELRRERLRTAAEQLQEKQQPSKLKRIWNIIKERTEPLFLGYCRRLSAVSVKNGRPGTHGRFFVGSAVQRPAGIKLRTANTPPRLVLVQGDCQTEEITCRRPPKTSGCDSRDKFFQP